MGSTREFVEECVREHGPITSTDIRERYDGDTSLRNVNRALNSLSNSWDVVEVVGYNKGGVRLWDSK